MQIARRGLIVLMMSGLTLTATVPSLAQKGKATKGSTKPSASLNDQVVATVGKEPIRYGDVERAFQKNMQRRETRLIDVPRDTMLDFLRLYTNYRLKVLNAYERGVDKDPAVVDEIANNRRMLSETTFFDKMIVDSRVEDLARRRQTEVELGVILCQVNDPKTGQPDSAASYRKAMAVIGLLKGGADFERVARDSSDDTETGAKGGRLPWITGGSIIKAVEDEAYALRPGSVSSTPVSTRFGHFVVKVFRAEPRITVRLRHILLGRNGERDSLQNNMLADSLKRILRMPASAAAAELRRRGITPSGDVFEDLANTYSDDPGGRGKGGSIGAPYSRSGGLESNGARMNTTFEAAAFALKDGEISDTVRTMYGLHLIKRDSSRTPDPLMERDNARRTYRRLYFEEDKRMLLDSLRKAWGYGWNQPALSRLMSSIDTTKNSSDTTWTRSIPADLRQQVLYRTPSTNFTVDMFADSLRRRLDMRGYSLNRAGMDRAINKITDADVLDRATKNLETTYPDFATLMREFNDGILLFKVEDQEVWSKLRFDTTEARAYYDSTRSRWMTDRRYQITEIYVTKDSMAKALRARIDKGAAVADLAAEYTERSGMREKRGNMGALEPRRSKLAEQARDANAVAGAVIGPFVHERGYSIIRVDGIEAPRQKSFEEAISDIAPAYQDMLQKRLQDNWLSEVRKRFPVVINTRVIDQLYAGSK